MVAFSTSTCLWCNLVSLYKGHSYVFCWIHVCFSVDAFDTEQLLECIGKLKSGQSVHVPIYDFKNHRRCSGSFRQVCTLSHIEWKMLFELTGGGFYKDGFTLHHHWVLEIIKFFAKIIIWEKQVELCYWKFNLIVLSLFLW